MWIWCLQTQHFIDGSIDDPRDPGWRSGNNKPYYSLRRTSEESEGMQDIALKSLPPTVESIRELRILRCVQGHPNVIKLFRAEATATQVSLYMEHHPPNSTRSYCRVS